MKSRKMRDNMAEHWNKENARTAIKAAAVYLTSQEKATLQGYLKNDDLDKIFKGIATMLHNHLGQKDKREQVDAG